MTCLATLVVAAIVAFEDARTRTIKNLWCALMAGLGVAFQLARAAAPEKLSQLPVEAALNRAEPSPASCLIVAALSLGLLVAAELFLRRFRGTRGMGMGDAKYLSAGLTVAGPELLLWASFALLAGATVAFLRGRDTLALGPWLSLALVLTLVFALL